MNKVVIDLEDFLFSFDKIHATNASRVYIMVQTIEKTIPGGVKNDLFSSSYHGLMLA